MASGTAFGFRGLIDSDQGRKLVVLVTWIPPNATKANAAEHSQQVYFGTVRNHSLFAHCYRLDRPSDMVAGDWKLAVYVVGIDERISAARERLSERRPTLVFQQTFHVYSPETVP